MKTLFSCVPSGGRCIPASETGLRPFPILLTLLYGDYILSSGCISYVTMASDAPTFCHLNILCTPFECIIGIIWLGVNLNCFTKMCLSLWTHFCYNLSRVCLKLWWCLPVLGQWRRNSWEWVELWVGRSWNLFWLQDWPLKQVLSSPICSKG